MMQRNTTPGNRIITNIDCMTDHVRNLRRRTTDSIARGDLDCIAAEIDEVRRAVADALNDEFIQSAMDEHAYHRHPPSGGAGFYDGD